MAAQIRDEGVIPCETWGPSLKSTPNIFADAIPTLLQHLGTSGVLRGPNDTARYSRDWSGDYSGEPVAVLRPSTAEDVAAALRICSQHGLKVLPQGGNTGLVGGAIPDQLDQVILSLERLNRIRSVDFLALTMEVEAGCVLQNAKDAAAEHGCLLPLSLGAQGSCQIGGNIATNAGGLNVLRYGMMRSSVLGLEAVLSDGRIVSDLRPLRKNNTGLDLKQLFIGTEGTLGVVTAATLKLSPQPRWIETLWLSTESVEKVMQIYDLFRREAGDFLSAFELITASCLSLAREIDQGATVSPEAADLPAHALIEISSSGGPDLHEWVEQLVVVGIEKKLVKDGLLAQNIAQAKSFWRIRELMVEAQQRRGTHLRTDVSVPISAIASFIAEVEQVLAVALPGLQVVAYGHVGDGNVHVNALRPENMSEETFRGLIGLLTARVNEVVDRFGGSISAEHGIGLTKREALDQRLPEASRYVMQAVKTALDPGRLLSPGRILK
jgi:FAD/FMN-containing dehydrogenase